MVRKHQIKQDNLFKPLLSFVAGVALAANAVASIDVHLDDFEQFSTGTDLSATNYLPAVGTTVHALNDGTGTTAIATNMFGSQGMYIDLAASDGNNPTYYGYTNTLSQTLSNTVVSISWDVMLGSTNQYTGHTLYLTAQPGAPAYGFNYFLNIDAGNIYIYTNFNEFKIVGTVAPGVLITNRIDYNLTSGIYDYYVNGVQLLANEPIPVDYMTTNSLSSFGFDFYSFDSAQTQFFLDNVVLSIPEPTMAGLLSIGGALLVARRRRS